MTKTLKTTIIAIAIFAFGFVLINANAQEAADVNLAVNPGNLTITATWSLDLWTVDHSLTEQTKEWTFSADSFYVTDFKWSASGYQTTVQVTDLTGTYEGTPVSIPASNVEFKSNAINLMAGTGNADVTLWIATFAEIGTTPLNYFLRANGTTAGILWQYGDNPTIKVTIPANQAPGNYHGTITFTLSEPGN